MHSIDKIIEMLDEENSQKIQEKGIKLGKKIKNINVFILNANFGVWENCAKILASKTDEELSPYLLNLLIWIQDLNWPGAMIILERMKKFKEVEMLSVYIRDIAKIANGEKIECDENWLLYMSELLDNKKLREKLPKEILNILKPYYYNKEDFMDSYMFYSKIIYGILENEYITKDECVQKLNELNEKYEKQEYYGELLNKIMENDNLDIASRAAKDSLEHNINIEKATKILEEKSINKKDNESIKDYLKY